MRLIVLVACLSLLASCKRNEEAPSGPDAGAAPSSRRIEIAVSERGFAPTSVDVDAGEPITLRFTRTSDHGCGTSVAFPDLGITRELPLNASVDVPITAPKTGKVLFQCGMGMFRGRVLVREP